MKTNSTQENLKRYFYSGIGHISHTGDVIQKSAKELARQGRATETDGRKIVDNAIVEMERRYNEAVHSLVDFTRSEVTALQKSLGMLEKRMMVKPKRAGSASNHWTKVSGRGQNHRAGRTSRLAT